MTLTLTLASSELFYSTAKWQVTQSTINQTKNQTRDKFQVFLQIDYVDDGNTMFDYNYLDWYISNLINEYLKIAIGIEINCQKTLVAVKTDNEMVKNSIQLIVNRSIMHPQSQGKLGSIAIT